MMPVHTILHPTDFSEQSRCAFQLACSLARDCGAHLIVVHVMQPMAVFFGDGLVPPHPDGYEEEIGSNLNRQHRAVGLPVVHLLESGQPVEEVLRVAHESHVDLIVMGTHGRHGPRRMLMGNVAERVMRAAPCPVMTVKSPILMRVPASRHEGYATAECEPAQREPAHREPALAVAD
jgi:nucleotide-binding universal stress UspA family protein